VRGGGGGRGGRGGGRGGGGGGGKVVRGSENRGRRAFGEGFT
jgi:hypothetical protein